MIFQEPMVSLNPLHKIGKQLVETLAIHRGLRATAAEQKRLNGLARWGFVILKLRSMPIRMNSQAVSGNV